MTTTHAQPSCDQGFTLVELLVAMVISLIVLFATLQSLDAFSSQASHQTKVTDANAQVRTTMDRAVRDLRGAAAITRASATDLVYTVDDPAGRRTERVCLSAANALYGASIASAATPATACGTLRLGWSGGKIAMLNSSTATAFNSDSDNRQGCRAHVQAGGVRDRGHDPGNAAYGSAPACTLSPSRRDGASVPAARRTTALARRVLRVVRAPLTASRFANICRATWCRSRTARASWSPSMAVRLRG